MKNCHIKNLDLKRSIDKDRWPFNQCMLMIRFSIKFSFENGKTCILLLDVWLYKISLQIQH